MASPTPIDPFTPTDHFCAEPLDLDLDLRDAGRDGVGVIDLSQRIRPVGGRRSSRHTHTRLVAALARIQATTLASDELAPDASRDRAPAACGPDRS